MPTETQSKHTHLQILDGYDPPIIGWERGDGDHHVAEIICQPNDADTDLFAARLVACWNACIGINPEAVPDLLDLGKKLVWDEPGFCEDMMEIAVRPKHYRAFVAALARAQPQ